MDLNTTAADLGRAIESGQADPAELAEAYLGAIAAHPHRDRIYARATPDRARAEARAARARAKSGTRRGPLDGVPLSWKDLYDTAGVPTEAGTTLVAGRTPTHDAEVLTRATLRGTVCLGKTHMTELAFSGLGLNPNTATPPNIHDPGALPGGSSSGAAASVAFGLAPAAIGSDTGGSIRLPAAWNDLVGFKPAHGALPLTGVVPLCPSFDTVGPIARSVEDAALIWEALGGPRTDLAGATLAGATFGVLRDVVLDGLEDAPARAFDAALDRLAQAGARIVDIRLPRLPRAYEIGVPLYGAEAWASWREHVEPAPHKVFAPVLTRVSSGREVLAADYLIAMDELRAIRAEARDPLAGLDALLCPTSPILPPQAAAVEADHELFRTRNLLALRNTRMANLLGLASVSIPTGNPSCGLMLSVLPGREGQVLRTAQAALRGWA
ncbi:Asp-tRNAAsn/Glu-tRNAGln amidotransferase A subunit [Rubellimicrobium mesophilum DSM 19309]|uniref:Asp-tRNAAsn/Glu-tRNAGln amidotransferase A subunit n=1 Tax=Rubellimicrobium mesophilum DSM 19309 TaxID=442562 RepID=A0A017HLQ4_9RHOB|nr:amidase family protein [Rubellimicrobium mesophilum]EYD74709.1 Asp-tRNAAsn/Glu-tRNAGln amidotransferase A subunit [Rubellimicrobium mesophilum DSM 19309]